MDSVYEFRSRVRLEDRFQLSDSPVANPHPRTGGVPPGHGFRNPSVRGEGGGSTTPHTNIKAGRAVGTLRGSSWKAVGNGRADYGTGLPDSALVGDGLHSRVADSTTDSFSNTEVIDVDLFEAAQG